MKEKSASNLNLFLNTADDKSIIRIFSDSKILAEKKIQSKSELSEKLLVEIERLLKSKKLIFFDLSSVSVFVGPGSYTGLRIGVTVANFLAWSLGIPLFSADKKGKIISGIKKFVLPKYLHKPKITKSKK
ncbi:MAG: hypothetical protein Athens101428_670 [Candidatus Berkelbacteria bacterium Athens1014_28]|uniref:Gcp-like domain-containing protein n=1 Tax=Candidatus Berkelbacteria bacterium Athens1014_28 TaxID=2017145 RepID=A0A554LKT6_9BACT|nr:MAG: hypothetical protein Athens101428_670 [Candidatus Berkelbacteria bacterium Athens1014_28]